VAVARFLRSQQQCLAGFASLPGCLSVRHGRFTLAGAKCAFIIFTKDRDTLRLIRIKRTSLQTDRTRPWRGTSDELAKASQHQATTGDRKAAKQAKRTTDYIRRRDAPSENAKKQQQEETATMPYPLLPPSRFQRLCVSAVTSSLPFQLYLVKHDDESAPTAKSTVPTTTTRLWCKRS